MLQTKTVDSILGQFEKLRRQLLKVADKKQVAQDTFTIAASDAKRGATIAAAEKDRALRVAGKIEELIK